MTLSRKSKKKLSSNYKILLRELDDLTVAEKTKPIKIEPSRGRLDEVQPATRPNLISSTLTKKKVGRPKGPSLINTAKLLTG